MPIKDWPKMSRDELIHTFEWAQNIGFYFIAKEIYKEMVKRGYIKDEETDNRRQ